MDEISDPKNVQEQNEFLIKAQKDGSLPNHLTLI